MDNVTYKNFIIEIIPDSEYASGYQHRVLTNTCKSVCPTFAYLEDAKKFIDCNCEWGLYDSQTKS
jgi:hypothetical protein